MMAEGEKKEVTRTEVNIDTAILEMINAGVRLVNNECNNHPNINSVPIITEFVKVLLEAKKELTPTSAVAVKR